MKCSHKRENCGIVIRFNGELGHHEAAQCVEYLEKTMTLYATEPIFLDLSGLTFMDSSGIAVVLGAQRNVLGAGQTFTVVGVFFRRAVSSGAYSLFRSCRICRSRRMRRKSHAQRNQPDEYQIPKSFQ